MMRFIFSNFDPVPGGIWDDRGIVYPTVEHAYQAAKTLDVAERQRIALLPTPGQAKRAGRSLILRPDWNDDLAVQTMTAFVVQKFLREPFGSQLANFDGPIVEWNGWHDNRWGDCVCGRRDCMAPGSNWLGRILEAVRTLLQTIDSLE